jgi:hypothetical protein
MFFQWGGISGIIPFVITQLFKKSENLRKNSISQTTGSQILSFKPLEFYTCITVTEIFMQSRTAMENTKQELCKKK